MHSRSFLLLLMVLASVAGGAPLGTAFTYQGELKQLGAPANGPYDFRFGLHALESGGSPVAGPLALDEVIVADGVFTVELDFGSAAFDGEQLWLGIEVREGGSSGAYVALAPRQKITAAPYALTALNDSDEQDLELNGNTLSLTNDATSVDLSVYLDDTDEQTFAEVLAQGNDAEGLSLENLSGLEVYGGNLTQFPGDPQLRGGINLGQLSPISVTGSGSYVYLVDHAGDRLLVVDISRPVGPLQLIGFLNIGAFPRSVAVAARYVYIAESIPGSLRIVDVSDPKTPTLAGTLALGVPLAVAVSGRYAYLVDAGSDELVVVDVSDPGAPSVIGSLGIGTNPRSVFVSGRYAYVVDFDSMDLKVIDVSNPEAPSLAGFVGLGGAPKSVFVSGRFAYVVDQDSDDLKVIDVSDPSAPSVAGVVAVGPMPESVFVSGRYAYVVDSVSHDLQVIDVSYPYLPVLAGHYQSGNLDMLSVYVAGRHAFVGTSLGLAALDVSGVEATSVIAHSLEAGQLQVRNDIVAQGQLQVTGGVNVGAGGLYSDGNVGVSGTIAIANDTVPSSSPPNLVQLYAEDSAGSSELKVRDEAGNVTTLSPHNFSLIGKPSEPLAWSHYSENERARINVDMLRTVRVVERLSGERLVYIEAKDGVSSAAIAAAEPPVSVLEILRELEAANAALEQRLAELESRLE